MITLWSTIDICSERVQNAICKNNQKLINQTATKKPLQPPIWIECMSTGGKKPIKRGLISMIRQACNWVIENKIEVSESCL